jgi:hypothetical protein
VMRAASASFLWGVALSSYKRTAAHATTPPLSRAGFVTVNMFDRGAAGGTNRGGDPELCRANFVLFFGLERVFFLHKRHSAIAGAVVPPIAPC